MGRLPKPVDKANDATTVAMSVFWQHLISGYGRSSDTIRQWSSTTIEEWNDVLRIASRADRRVQSRHVLSGRLFDYRDELRRSMRQFRKERMTSGDFDAAWSSPMLDAVMRLERMITPLEDRFGYVHQWRG